MTYAMNAISTDDSLWQAVLARDARSDGRFVYAVKSTGIYCRPSCPSRRAEARIGAVLSWAGLRRARGIPRVPPLPSARRRAARAGHRSRAESDELHRVAR